jgi:bacitracin synthase 3
MVPVQYWHLDTFPLTNNGKIDRQALPDIPVNNFTGHEEPVNEMEEQLVEIWCSLLQLNKEQVGRHTHFFEAGGHSLKASVLINRIRQTFNADLTIKDIFSAPTIRQLAACIQQKATIEVII